MLKVPLDSSTISLCQQYVRIIQQRSTEVVKKYLQGRKSSDLNYSQQWSATLGCALCPQRDPPTTGPPSVMARRPMHMMFTKDQQKLSRNLWHLEFITFQPQSTIVNCLKTGLRPKRYTGADSTALRQFTDRRGTASSYNSAKVNRSHHVYRDPIRPSKTSPCGS